MWLRRLSLRRIWLSKPIHAISIEPHSPRTILCCRCPVCHPLPASRLWSSLTAACCRRMAAFWRCAKSNSGFGSVSALQRAILASMSSGRSHAYLRSRVVSKGLPAASARLGDWYSPAPGGIRARNRLCAAHWNGLTILHQEIADCFEFC
jgi:hypothetical protein